MLFTTAAATSLLATVTLGFTVEAGNQYQAPKSSDIRSPCPGLNTLANYGYLPRDGSAFSRQTLLDASKKVYNFQPEAIDSVLQSALDLGLGNKAAQTIGLQDLTDSHNKIEHDGSLSRSDRFFSESAQSTTPNATLVNILTTKYAKDGVISLWNLGGYRQWRLKEAEKINPDFSFENDQVKASVIESIILLAVLGQGKNEIPVEWIKPFLLEGKLADGFTQNPNEITVDDFKALLLPVAIASNVPHINWNFLNLFQF